MLEVFLLRSWRPLGVIPAAIRVVEKDVTMVTIDRHRCAAYFPGFESLEINTQVMPTGAQGDSSDLDYTVKASRTLSQKDKLFLSGLGYRIIFNFEGVEGSSNRAARVYFDIFDSTGLKHLDTIELSKNACTEIIEHNKDVRRVLKAFPSCKTICMDLRPNLVTVWVDDKEILSVPRYGTFPVPDESAFASTSKCFSGVLGRLSDAQKNSTWTHFNKLVESSMKCYFESSPESDRDKFEKNFRQVLDAYGWLSKQCDDQTDETKKVRISDCITSMQSQDLFTSMQSQGMFTRYNYRSGSRFSWFLDLASRGFKAKKPPNNLSNTKQHEKLISDYALEHDFGVVCWSPFFENIVMKSVSEVGITLVQKCKQKYLRPPVPDISIDLEFKEKMRSKLAQFPDYPGITGEYVEFILWKSQYLIAFGREQGSNIIVDLPRLLSGDFSDQSQGRCCKLLSPLLQSRNWIHTAEDELVSPTSSTKVVSIPKKSRMGSLCEYLLQYEIVNAWGITLIYRNPESHEYNYTVCCLRFQESISEVEWEFKEVFPKSRFGQKFLLCIAGWDSSKHRVVGHFCNGAAGEVGLLGFLYQNGQMRIIEKYTPDLLSQPDEIFRGDLSQKVFCKRNRMFSILCRQRPAVVAVHVLQQGRFVLLKRVASTRVEGRHVDELGLEGRGSVLLPGLLTASAEVADGPLLLKYFRLGPLFY